MEKEEEALIESVNNALSKIMEHADSVQVFVTKLKDDGSGTFFMSKGAGNYFSRYGQVDSWVRREQLPKNLEEDDEDKD